MFFLERAKQDSWVEIVDFEGNCQIRQKLQGIGLYKGDQIYILQSKKNGPMIVVKEKIKIALGAGLKKKILVNEVSQKI